MPQFLFSAFLPLPSGLGGERASPGSKNVTNFHTILVHFLFQYGHDIDLEVVQVGDANGLCDSDNKLKNWQLFQMMVCLLLHFLEKIVTSLKS